MSLKRKMARAVNGGDVERQRAERYYGKYGQRAVEMALVCRQHGFRDLLVPLTNMAECLPTVAVPERCRCMYGRQWGAHPCRKDAVICHLADTGLVLYFCEEHSDLRAVRLQAQG